MNLMPSNVVTLARATLLGLIPGATALLLAPAHTVASLVPMDSALVHAGLFYGVTAVAFVAFPRLRRSDMAGIAVVMAGLVELVQLATGHGGQMSDWLAGASGVGALYAPTMLEQMRHMARKHAYSTFSDLAANDRRKRKKNKPAVAAHSVDHFSVSGA